MNDDALAAVVTAASMLLARTAEPVPVTVCARWKLAGRLHRQGVLEARAIARTRSRWALSGRLRD